MPSGNRGIHEEWASGIQGITGPASVQPQRIRTFPDVGVRRRQVESEYFRIEGTHVIAGTDYPPFTPVSSIPAGWLGVKH